MINRDWRYIAVIGGLSLAIALHSDGVSRPQGNSAQSNAVLQQAPPKQVALAVQQDAAPKRTRCRGAQAGEEDSLCYERRAAEASEKQAGEARINNILGLVQAVGLGLTLFLTLYGLNIARRALIQVERAFVYVDKVSTESHGEGFVAITIKWKNSGSTPAVRCVLSASCGVFPDPLPDDFDFPDYDPTGKQYDRYDGPYGATFIGPGAETSSGLFTITVAHLRGVLEGKLHAYIWAWAEYDDILFGPRHRTEYCAAVRVHNPLEETVADGTSEFSAVIGFEHYPRYNAVDDQCSKRPRRWVAKQSG